MSHTSVGYEAGPDLSSLMSYPEDDRKDSVSSAGSNLIATSGGGGTLNDKQLFDILKADKNAKKKVRPKVYDQRDDNKLRQLHHGWLLEKVRT